MLQKSKRFLSLFMLTLTLVCCSFMFTACKKGKKDSDDDADNGGGGTTPVVKIDLTADMLTLEYETVVFDRNSKEPTVTVKNGETTIEATEYDVSYSNNTNVGTATVTVEAKSDSDVLKGSASKNFTITVAELPEIDVIEEGIWTGESVLPTVEIGELVSGTDFDLAWEYKANGAEDDEYEALDTAANNFVEEGYYRVTATGKGNYEGTQVAVYAIKKELPAITPIDSVKYDGDSHVPTVVVGTLIAGDDYEVSYEYAPHGSDNFLPYGVEEGKDAFVSAGKYKIIARGLGLYGGTKEFVYIIEGDDLPDLQLTGTSTTFDGSAKTIEARILGLTENVDYAITYEFRRFGVEHFEPYTNPLFVYAGEYKVIATGMGSYQGTQEEIFTINRAAITPTVEKADYVYNAETDKITLSGNSGGADVVFYYTDDATIGADVTSEGWEVYTPGMKLDAGTYYIYASVAASNDYAAGVSNIDTFEVLKDELKGIMSLNGLKVTYDGNSHKQTFIINSQLNSNPLVEGQDYELEWKYFDTNNPLAPEVILDNDAEFINVGQYTVTLKGLGNYDVSDPSSSEMTTYFTITPIKFDKFTVKRASWTYGETPSKIDVKATNTTGNSVLELEDVEITFYCIKDGTSTKIYIDETTVLEAGSYVLYAVAEKDNYEVFTTGNRADACFDVLEAQG